MGVPVTFPLELVGKSCCVINKVEMVEVGGKGEVFGKGREGMAGEIDDGDNLGVVE